MKHHMKSLIGLVGCLLLLGTLSTVAQDLSLQESFDDPALPGWERTPDVRVEEGVLTIPAQNFAFYREHQGDFTLSVDVQLSGDGELIFLYRTGEGYANILVIGNHFVLLQREQAGQIDEIAGVHGLSILSDRWFNLVISASASDHIISIDGTVILEAIDPRRPLPLGGIGFEVYGEATGYYDNLELLSESAETIPTAPTTTHNLTWVRTGGPPGGLGYDIRMRPDNPDIMYVSDAWAGVFRSTDGGQTWFPSNNGITTRTGVSLDAVPIFCLTIDPHDNDTLWVGTQFTGNLFRSSDGGDTWHQRDTGITMDGLTFRGITIDPQSSDIIYAAGEVASWTWAREERMGREFDMTQGIVFRSVDGGESWSQVWQGNNLARYVWIDPRDSNIIYISTGIFDREAANSDPQAGIAGGVGIVRSIDGGQTWMSMTDGLDNLYVGTLFMHPENPDILLAGAGNIQYPDRGGVYRTIDGGITWQRTLSNQLIESVEFSLSNPEIAYAGSADAILRSDDGGQTWELMSGGDVHGWGSPGVRAGFPIDFQIDPRDANRIFVNNYGGGNFLSLDGGRTWSVASAGYTGAQVRDVAVDPSNPMRVFAAARSGIFSSGDGGATWVGLNSPPARTLEWYVVAIDPENHGHILAANNWNGSMLESNDGGQNWHVAGDFAGDGRSWRAIVYAPSDSNIVYAGMSAFYSAGTFDDTLESGGIHISYDRGATWDSVNDSLSQDANVTALAVAYDNPSVVYAATGNRGLLRTTDGGQSWVALNIGQRAAPVVLSVAIHPGNSDVVFVGFWHGGIYRTTDGGITWQDVSAGLAPEALVADIVFDPVDAQIMYITDRLSGVYRSADGGTTWHALNNGLLMRDVNSLAISLDGQYLYAGSEGAGVFRLDLGR